MPVRIKKKCLNCGTVRKAHRSAVKFKFCSNECQQEHAFKLNYTRWLNEEEVWRTSTALKRAITVRDGYKCKECGLKEWNNKPVTLELEHIDGDYQNRLSNNLCLLCPNCHSQTPTFRAKNWGNGRHCRISGKEPIRQTLKKELPT